MILPLVMFLALAQHPCSGGSQPKNDPECIPAEQWFHMQESCVKGQYFLNGRCITPPEQRHEDGAWTTPPKVTIVGVGQDEMQKDFLICDAMLGKFQNCALAGGATLDDLAFWQGYSAHIVGDVLKKLQKENDELREDNRKLRLALKAIQAMAADKAGKK